MARYIRGLLVGALYSLVGCYFLSAKFPPEMAQLSMLVGAVIVLIVLIMGVIHEIFIE